MQGWATSIAIIEISLTVEQHFQIENADPKPPFFNHNIPPLHYLNGGLVAGCCIGEIQLVTVIIFGGHDYNFWVGGCYNFWVGCGCGCG